MDFPRECRNPGAMQALGRDLAGELAGGAVVGLDGDLGAGKTEFVKGLAAGMGFGGVVTSPTFTLLHEYEAGARTLYHLDFYRVGHGEEILALGWDELLEEPTGVVVVEWAGKFPELLPPEALRLRVEMQPSGERQLLCDSA
ncbi:MAG: tRNA (adenosine(37)-N6)-threonylcarbamoyltransferase complex ATPase subunit type 1 TsaE [Roseibacillus sp.]|nr:tRNA (adenosine(37)-N6)-threonylcarbamoyltransferase complex ATPase subunit type 1 TsaE [Roseibacillus sp.]